MFSMIKRGVRQESPEKPVGGASLVAMRALCGWNSANRSADQLKPVAGEENYCLIRYEDLVLRPMLVFESLERFLMIDLRGVAERVASGSFEVDSCQISGNRMRYSRRVDVRPDLTWVGRLTVSPRLIAKAGAARRLREYGYR